MYWNNAVLHFHGQMAAAGGNLFYVEEVDGVRITRVLIHCAEDLEKEHDEIVDMP